MRGSSPEKIRQAQQSRKFGSTVKRPQIPNRGGLEVAKNYEAAKVYRKCVSKLDGDIILVNHRLYSVVQMTYWEML